MSLAKCLKKVSGQLNDSDIKLVKAEFQDARELGEDAKEAGIIAASELLKSLQAERKTIVSQIESQGGRAPRRAEIQETENIPTKEQETPQPEKPQSVLDQESRVEKGFEITPVAQRLRRVEGSILANGIAKALKNAAAFSQEATKKQAAPKAKRQPEVKAETEPKNGGVYEPTEGYNLEPNPTDEEAHEDNAGAIKRSLDGLRRVKGSILGNAIPKDFKNQGSTRLVGQTVKNSHDLAVLAQVYRNPSFETLRVFYVKNDKVVGQTGLTSKMPNYVIGVYEALTEKAMENSIPQQMEALEADGYYLLHNHPTGNVTPSNTDFAFTDAVTKKIDGFKQHIVINDTTYAVFGANEPAEYKKIDKNILEYDRSKPQKDHPFLGFQVSGAASLVVMGRELRREGYATLIGFSGLKNEVKGIAEIPIESLEKNETVLLAELNSFGRMTGSAQIGLTGIPKKLRSNPKAKALFNKAIENSHVVDVIFDDGLTLRGAVSPKREFLRPGRFTLNEQSGNYQVADYKGFAPAAENRKEQFIRNIQDRHRVLKKTIENIQKAGGNVTDYNNAYLAEERFHGKTEEDLRQLEEKHVKPIVDAMVKADVSQDELDLFLIARHAQERNAYIASINEAMPDGGSGMTNAEAKAVLAAVRKDERFEDFKKIAAKVDRMLAVRRKRMVAAGLMDQQQIDTWENNYKYYVPLKGFAFDAIDDAHPRTGSGFAIKGNESFRAMGRQSAPASPLLHAISDTSTSMIRSRKNEVGQSLKALIEDNPNPEYWGVFTQENPDTERGFDAQGNVIPDAPVQMWNFTNRLHPNGSLYMPVKEGGKIHYLKITDPRMSKALVNLDPDANNVLLRASATAVRFLSTMSTSWNPEFVLTNFSRDIQTAVYNLLAEESLDTGKAKGMKIAKQMVKDAPKAVRAIYRHYRGKDITNEFGEYFEEFLKDGTKTGFFDSKSIDQQQKAVNRMLSMAKGGVKGKAFKWQKALFDYIEHANTSIENGVRLSAYVHARKNGASRVQASSLAKNLTVNFNRKGQLGPTINALYMFANASIQGTATFARSMLTMKTTAEGKKRLNAGQIAALGLGVAGYSLSHIARYFGGQDDDGEDWIDKVPAYERERNIVLFNPFGDPGERFNIPLPYGFNIFYNMGDSLESLLHSESEMRSPSVLGTELAMSFMGSFSPISFQTSLDTEKAAIKTITPTLAQPIVQLAVNENYYGAPIYKEQAWFEDQKAESYLSMKDTKAVYKEFAQFMNNLTGGNEHVPGAIDISPDSIEHVMEFSFGGLYRTTDRTADTVRGMITGDKTDTRNIPFVRSVYKEPNPSQDQSLFYDRLDLAKRYTSEAESLRGRERLDFVRDNRPILRMHDMAEASAKELSALRKEKKALENSKLSDKLKKSREEKIDEKMQQIIKRFNQRWNETVN